MGRASWGLVALLAALVVAVAAGRLRREEHVAEARARAIPAIGKSGYAGSGACKTCHPTAYASWHGTYHRTMTQPATRQSVLAPFDGRTLGPGGRVRVGRSGDAFWVAENGGERRPVVMVTGSHHMQVYWLSDGEPHGRLTAFAFAYLIDDERWVPNEHTLLRPPDAAPVYTWNRVCIKCHAVSGAPGFDPQTQRVDTQVAELGIACEACHGPAAQHVAANRDPTRRYLSRFSSDPDPTVFNPARHSERQSSEVCAQCHSITLFEDDDAWVQHGSQAGPGDGLAALGRLVRHPVNADQPWLDAVLEVNPDFISQRFWSDGMVRVSGREYNGLVESRCVEGDLGCTTCHSMHGGPPNDQLRPQAQGDNVCSECHPGYDRPAHTHHAAGTAGSRCYDCHMPRTTYGLLGAIRSHQIDSPDVAVELVTRRPNACNLCHLDQTRAWAADQLAAWYDVPVPADLGSDERAALAVWLLEGDAGVRALAAWHAGDPESTNTAGQDWMVPLLAEALVDEYAAVRTIARRSLHRGGWPQPPDADGAGAGSARRELLRAWSSRDHVPDRFGPRVLLDSSRAVDRAGIDAMLARRDARPVSLAE